MKKRHLYKSVVLFFIGLFILAIGIGSLELYHTYYKHKLTTISDNRFYKSGSMPLDDLEKLIEDKKIKTVIDLRKSEDVGSKNHLLISQENEMVIKKLGINYFNIPSAQIPTNENISEYLNIIKKEGNYPILVHCHDGVGRAVLFSALYRIEKEGWEPEKARTEARLFPMFNNFNVYSKKGKFLSQYGDLRKGKFLCKVNDKESEEDLSRAQSN